jgi:hypothetical protein
MSMEEAHSSLLVPTEKGVTNSLTTVLSQEIDRYNRLLSVIRTTLYEFQRALKGNEFHKEIFLMNRSYCNVRKPGTDGDKSFG